MAILAVYADANDFGSQALELLDAIAEGTYLGGTDEGKVQGIEEKHLKLALEVRIGQVLDFPTDGRFA